MSFSSPWVYPRVEKARTGFRLLTDSHQVPIVCQAGCQRLEVELRREGIHRSKPFAVSWVFVIQVQEYQGHVTHTVGEGSIKEVRLKLVFMGQRRKITPHVEKEFLSSL